ncbi:MAG TPA: ABC transporter substrate-binding protein, partial [Orrella sp.]
RSTQIIKDREAALVQEFKDKGINIVEVDRQSFVDGVLQNVTPESLGYNREDYDRITALK